MDEILFCCALWWLAACFAVVGFRSLVSLHHYLSQRKTRLDSLDVAVIFCAPPTALILCAISALLLN